MYACDFFSNNFYALLSYTHQSRANGLWIIITIVKIVGVNDEKLIPYTTYTKITEDAGGIIWRRHPRGTISFERIQQIMKLSSDEAKSLPTEDKYIWIYLELDRDKRAAGRGNEMFSAEPIMLLVERQYYLRDSFGQFKTTTDLDLRKDIKIHFVNEVCQDAGGLIRDWFSVLIEGLFEPSFGLFTKSNTKEISYIFNEYSEKFHADHLEYFYFCGQVVAKALYERIPIKAYLNKIILKQILGVPVSIDDMKFIDTELYTSITYILSTHITPEMLIGNFTITKKDPTAAKPTETQIELKEGGAGIQIDDSNKAEFAELFFQNLFISNVQVQFKQFFSGFSSLVSPSLARVMDPDELDLFLCGGTELSVADWRENTTYAAPYSEGHPVVQNFWKMIGGMSQEDREKFLQFCTGSKRVPAEGFRGLRAANGQISRFRIEPRTIGGNAGGKIAPFVVAHTCFNKIELPMYPDLETMVGCVKKVLESPAYFQFTLE